MTTQLDPSFRASLSRYMAPDIVEALPARDAFNKASRHLNTLRVALASFLPKYIADQEELLTKEYSDLRQGTFMFADVSGFTALSAKLQQAKWLEGAEIMTQIINDFFSTMLEVLAKSDGQMLKFAGDALLTFFPVTSEETSRNPELTVAGKAIRTGLRMQRAMREKFQPIQHPLLAELFGDHNIELTMSIGISTGQLFEALVGNTSQRDHMIMGHLPGMANSAEEAGERDDVIIDSSLAAAFKDEFRYAPAPNNPYFYRVIDDLGEDLSDFELTTLVSRRRSSTLSGLMNFGEEPDYVEDLRNLMTRVDSFARFVAAEVVKQLAIEGDRVEPRNRPTTVIFAFFRGVARLLETWGIQELPRITNVLNRFYATMQQVIAVYGGSLTRSDPYKDGSKLLITFGAPIAHPDDPFRAVATALEMMAQLQQFNAKIDQEMPEYLKLGTYFELRMGITHGQAYAGEVGWKQRREYTVMGNDINLAARLMAKATTGEIWVNESIYNRVERFFKTVALEPMVMKGITNPVQAYSVIGWQDNITDIPKTSNTPFVGRDTILLTLQFALEQARARRRRAIALVGDTGMGKTRIAKQIIHDAEQKGFNCAWATCHTLDNSRVSWAAILSQLLDINHDDSLEVQQATLSEALTKLEVGQVAPVLDDLLFDGLHGSDTRLQADDDQNPLSDEAGRVVAEVVNALSKIAPVFIMLDDLHKAHPRAIQILNEVLETIKNGRLLMMLAYDPSFEFDLKPTMIEDLEPSETFRLATEILHVPELSSKFSRTLWEQTHGRPLYVEGMLQFWQEKELIGINKGVAELKEAKGGTIVPDTVRNLIISTLDRLPNDHQKAVAAAVVLATSEPTIEVEPVAYLCEIKDIEYVRQIVDDLIFKQIFVAASDGLFKIHYGLVQQAVYESLSRLQRQQLHNLAAEYWQERPDAGEHFFAIAAHLVKSGKMTRALEMVEAAAAEAERQGDIESALEYFEHATTLFPNDRSLHLAMGKLVKKAIQLYGKLPQKQPEAPKPEEEEVKPKKRKVDPLSISMVVRTVLEKEPRTPRAPDET